VRPARAYHPAERRLAAGAGGQRGIDLAHQYAYGLDPIAPADARLPQEVAASHYDDVGDSTVPS
jgi:hypothetical protein